MWRFTAPQPSIPWRLSRPSSGSTQGIRACSASGGGVTPRPATAASTGGCVPPQPTISAGRGRRILATSSFFGRLWASPPYSVQLDWRSTRAPLVTAIGVYGLWGLRGSPDAQARDNGAIVEFRHFVQ